MELVFLTKKEAVKAFPKHAVLNDLPRHMYGALWNGKIVAMAGLRLCEHPVCMLDSMASDPSAPGEVRNDALNALTVRLNALGRELGYQVMVAYTLEDSIVSRALKLGFKEYPGTLLVKEL